MYSAHSVIDLVEAGLVLVDEAGRIVEVNRAAEDLLGRPQTTLRGTPLAALFVGGDPLPRVLAAPRSPLRVRVRRPDDSELDLELEAREPVDCGRPLFLRRCDTASASSHALALQEALDCLPTAVVVWDERERLVACNAGFRALLPSARAGMPSSEMFEAFAPSMAVPLDGLRRRVEGPERCVPFEIDLPLRDGRTRRVVSRPTDAGGRIAILLDATDLLARERELEEARCAAEQASRAKTEFLAAMSHEVRTPLQSVLGYAELLLRGRQDPLAAAQRTMVERMLRAGVLVQRVVDDALDLARIEARVVALDLQEVDLPALLAQVHEVLALAASEQGVALHVPVGAQPPVHADSLRLAQILLNLGSNAIKYNRRGGWVHFGVGEDGDRVRVTVSDSGLGVPPAERGQLFRAFHRAGREGGSVPGSGIGLAISERLAREMGGELGYAPHPGGGSAFWVTLPRGAGEVPGRSSQVQVRAQARAALGARILYVSDDPASIALVASALAPLGATLLSAASVAHGLELARVERPDLLLLELGVDGLAALVALRSDPATAHLPAIALSAMASVSEVSSALVAGFASFVPKPVTPSTLETGLRSALAPRLARTA